MHTHAGKVNESKSEAAANKAVAQHDSSESLFRFTDNRPGTAAQQKMQEMANNSPAVKHTAQFRQIAGQSVHQQPLIQKKSNDTGLPDNLKSGIENLSGYSLDDVKVHYNSDKPGQLQAHAYAQGSEIHVASGQEKHLPHEAWHVVQQKQGRVRPTMQLKGQVNINDDAGLEAEADTMGAKALDPIGDAIQLAQESPASGAGQPGIIQRVKVAGDFENASEFAEISDGVYGVSQTIAHSRVETLVNGINDHLMDYFEDETIEEDDSQEMVILTGCHGDNMGNLIYNEDNFYAEDQVFAALGYVSAVINMQTLTREQQVAQMQRTDKIMILSWCYSSITYQNINTYTIVGGPPEAHDEDEEDDDDGQEEQEEVEEEEELQEEENGHHAAEDGDDAGVAEAALLQAIYEEELDFATRLNDLSDAYEAAGSATARNSIQRRWNAIERTLFNRWMMNGRRYTLWLNIRTINDHVDAPAPR